MEKKYILTRNDIINYNGHILYRIQSTKDFGDVNFTNNSILRHNDLINI
nr:MAG TPA: Putative transferase, nesg, ydcK, Structural Genomics.38A [Caudoviricetes sp.]